MWDAGGVLRVVRDWDGQGSTLRRPYIPQVIGSFEAKIVRVVGVMRIMRDEM